MPKITKPKAVVAAKHRTIAKSVPSKILKDLFGDEPKTKAKVKATPAKVRAAVKAVGKAAAVERAAVNKAKKAALAAKAKPKAKVTAAKTARKPVAKVKAKPVTTRKPRAKVVEAVKPIKTKFTKAGLIEHLATAADTDKKTAKTVLGELTRLMVGSIAPRSIGGFTLPGVLHIGTRKVPARKGGAMVLNRFTGQMVKQKAKAASTRVKVRPLSALKSAVM